MQRFFDILFSALALAVLSIPLLIVMVILRATGEGEIFYAQTRVGRNGKHFQLFKFATMLKNSPNIGAGEITLRHDPRVLPFGRFLRKTKLNELPQLFNILKGDISVIGPRPMVPRTFAEYDVVAQEELCTVRPGLSGIGSIIFRDEERYLDRPGDAALFYRRVIIPYKSELEQWYIRNRSLKVYFLLIFLTAWVIVFPTSRLPTRLFSDLPKPPPELQPSSGPDISRSGGAQEF